MNAKRLREHFDELDRAAKVAVLLLLAACFSGIIFALFGHAPLLTRLARLTIDALFIGGVLCYLADPVANAPRKPREFRWKAITIAARVLGIAIALAGIVFIITANPNLDFALRAYRISLAIILIVGLLFGTIRPIPRAWFARIVFVEIGIVIVELVVMFYILFTVDAPVMLAGIDHSITSVALAAEVPAGWQPASADPRRAVANSMHKTGLLLLANGTYHLAPEGYDMLRETGGKPLTTIVTTLEHRLLTGHRLEDPTDLFSDMACTSYPVPYGGYRSWIGIMTEIRRTSCDPKPLRPTTYTTILNDEIVLRHEPNGACGLTSRAFAALWLANDVVTIGEHATPGLEQFAWSVVDGETHSPGTLLAQRPTMLTFFKKACLAYVRAHRRHRQQTSRWPRAAARAGGQR